MFVVYTGSIRRVAVRQLRDMIVERGVPVEVPDAIGAALCEQRTWTAVEVRGTVEETADEAGPVDTGTPEPLPEIVEGDEQVERVSRVKRGK